MHPWPPEAVTSLPWLVAVLLTSVVALVVSVGRPAQALRVRFAGLLRFVFDGGGGQGEGKLHAALLTGLRPNAPALEFDQSSANA